MSRIVNRFKNGLSRLTYGGDVVEGNSAAVKVNVPSRPPMNPKPSVPPAKVLPKPASAVGPKRKQDLVEAMLFSLAFFQFILIFPCVILLGLTWKFDYFSCRSKVGGTFEKHSCQRK